MVSLLYFGLCYLSDFLLVIIRPFLSPQSKLYRILNGRKSSWKRLQQLPPKSKKRIWIHAASLGEFQMLLPLVNILETSFDLEVHVSFFSPSGFEYAEMSPLWKRYYLQHDTPQKAQRFLTYLNPDVAIFAKYEFWLAHLNALNTLQVPFIFWNTLLRKNHFLQKFWSSPWRNALEKTQLWCCQNQETCDIITALLNQPNCMITGDIRFLQTAETKNIPSIFTKEEEEYLQQKSNLVWGSSWQPELDILLALLPLNQGEYRFILAPHDVSEKNLLHIENQLNVPFCRLSQGIIQNPNAEVILVDGIGKLRFLYRYARLALVGGGFKNALHNIIEPLSNHVPVLFGSKHEKFPEAQEAVNHHAALHADTPEGLTDVLRFLLFHNRASHQLNYHQRKASEYFEAQKPKMEIVLPIFHKILTN
jgi:3-deoxy-D-manno-octulosonic-acid transferase